MVTFLVAQAYILLPKTLKRLIRAINSFFKNKRHTSIINFLETHKAMAQFHRVDPTALQTSVAQLGSIYKGSKIIYGVNDIDEFMPRLQLDIPTLNYVL